MKMSDIATVYAMCLGIGLAAGAAMMGPDPQAGGGDAALPSQCDRPPSQKSCWECLMEMYAICDKAQTKERREACYAAANMRYEWCLDHAPAPGGAVGSSRNQSTVIENDWDLLSAEYGVGLLAPPAGEIVVFVRDADGGVTQLPSEVVLGQTVVIPTMRQLYTMDDVGLVVAEVIDGQPMLVGSGVISMANTPDRNRDGVLDIFDAVEVMNDLSGGRLDKSTAYQMFGIISAG